MRRFEELTREQLEQRIKDFQNSTETAKAIIIHYQEMIEELTAEIESKSFQDNDIANKQYSNV